MLNKILLPIDGSALSLKASQEAVALAARLNASLVGLTVYSPYPYPVYGELIPPEMPDIYLQRVKQDAETILQALRELATSHQVPLQTFSKEAFAPWECIIETAKTEHCDSIIMASHGRRGFASLLLGSETQKVLTHCHIPVLVVR